MNLKEFSPEEVIELRSNQYVIGVTTKTVRLTVAFKEQFWSEYNAGKTPRSIVASMGFDPNVLGSSRINGIVNRIRDEANSGTGFREGRYQPECEADLSTLPLSRAVGFMQHQIAYMRQEVEFIKKTILADNAARREK